MPRTRDMRGLVRLATAGAVTLLLAAGHGVAAPDPASPSSQPNGTSRSPHGKLAMPCQDCHTQSGWVPVRQAPDFDHGKTRYPLRGLHEKVPCKSCHTKLVFEDVSTLCADCHADIHKRKLGAACEQCHSVKGWHVSVQAVHEHQNRFPLAGAHAALDCAACHKGAARSQFQGLATQCYVCHAKDYQRATSPRHAASGFPTACEQCHGMNGWLGARFDHAKNTGFALTGAHAGADCRSCHAGGRYAGTPSDCASCHRGDYRAADNPDHDALSFPETCETCHTTAAWSPARFDHATSGFPLTGAHAFTPCQSCHPNGNYNLADTACASCHMDDYQRAREPDHARAGYSTQCQTCHDTTTWGNATFDHASTGFPLTGSHAQTPCSSCHVNGNYDLDTACASCHMDDYQRTTAPNHAQAGYPVTCQDCHDTTDWGNATFDHASTGFPLTGAHAPLPCASCHVGGNYDLDPACASCHMKEYQGTKDPDHAKAGFPTTCETCHTTRSWGGATFDHSRTRFPLTGAHTGLDCLSCHASGTYKGLPTACASCHLDDYQRTTRPNHAAAGFPQACELCHGTSAWVPSSFDHARTAFPLTGAHTTTPCALCHVNGNYSNVPTDCYSCHKSQYQQTTNPNHAAAGFPTTCETCHSTTSWEGARFDHTWFRIPHKGYGACRDCHGNPSNYSVFSCIDCHAHEKTKMDEKHRGENGYAYESTACYGCHRDARLR